MTQVIDVLEEEEQLALEPRVEPKPTQFPALEVLKRTHLTPLEAHLFDILLNSIGELNEAHPDVPGLVQSLLDIKMSAMEVIFLEKFRITSLDKAREQNLQLKVRPDGTIELCKGR